MKKIFVICTVLCAMFLLAGCGKKSKPDVSGKAISSFEMTWYESPEGAIRFVVDYKDKTVKKKVYDTNSEENEKSFTKFDELQKIIDDKLIASYGEDEGVSYNNTVSKDDRKVLWHIRIRYEDSERVDFESFDVHPDYVKELYELLNW